MTAHARAPGAVASGHRAQKTEQIENINPTATTPNVESARQAAPTSRTPAEVSAPSLRLVTGFATSDETTSVNSDETKAPKGGRPRKHDDQAARQRAYRARNTGIVTWRLGDVADKVAEIAAAADLPANELAHYMLKFALCNRNWKEEPVFGKLLPNAARKEPKR